MTSKGAEGLGRAAEGVRLTVITEWPEITVRPEEGGRAERMGRVVFCIVAPTWLWALKGFQAEKLSEFSLSRGTFCISVDWGWGLYHHSPGIRAI